MTDRDLYSDYRSGPGENLLAQISEVAREAMERERRVEELQDQLEEERAQLRLVREKTLPDLMDVAEMDEVTTRDGIVIKVSENLRGSIPKKTEAEALRWLEENDHGNLIKRQFTIEFGKGDEAWANKFERDMARRKKPLNMKRRAAVHPQSLLAFCREQLSEGEVLPLDIFGVFRQRVANIKTKD